MLPLFSYLKFMPHIDGTASLPPDTILVEDKLVPDPAFLTWNDLDQEVVKLLNSSLTEEVASGVHILPTAR